MRVLMAVCLVASLASAEEIAWTDGGESHGTHVWYRDLPDANARQIRAETVIAAKPERVWDVVCDIEHYREFLPYLAEIRKLDSFEGGYFQYERVNPPIIDERDYTLKVRLLADAEGGVWRRSWALANDRGPPPVEGVVRVIVNAGSFELKPDGEGGTRFTYTLLTNPGGSVPMWIAKRASTSSVPDLLDAIRHRSLDPAWKR